MMKKILTFLKKVILVAFMLYAYNLIMAPLNLLLPINIYTIGFVSLFGLMAIPFLVLILTIVF